MKLKIRLLSLALLLVPLVVQAGGAVSADAIALPLLTSGKHVSFIKGFNASQPRKTNRRMNRAWRKALAAGMDVSRIQVDWAELEPRPGDYDTKRLEALLAQMEADELQSFVLLSTIDSDGYTIPSDLKNDESETLLADGMRFDDLRIVQRFRALLDWVVPMVVDHGGWVLSVGNEPGNFLSDAPEAERPMVNFLAAAREHAHGIDPRLAITMTLAYWNLEQGHSFHIPILEKSDVASFNYYASDTDVFFDDNPASINNEIDTMLAAAGEKYLIFQELGAAAGYDRFPSQMNATKKKQAAFFDAVFTRMEAEERMRVAVVFQLVDWDPKLVEEVYTRPFLQEGLPEDFVLRFAESLETIGLLRFASGTKRRAWRRVLKQIKKFSTRE